VIPIETEGQFIIPSSIGKITSPITKESTLYGKPCQASFYGRSRKNTIDEYFRMNTEMQSTPKKLF